jgi:hypothetical protein
LTSRDSIGRNAPRFSLERCASAMIACCAGVGANAPKGGDAGSLAAAMPGGVADIVKMFSSKTCECRVYIADFAGGSNDTRGGRQKNAST